MSNRGNAKVGSRVSGLPEIEWVYEVSAKMRFPWMPCFVYGKDCVIMGNEEIA